MKIFGANFLKANAMCSTQVAVVDVRVLVLIVRDSTLGILIASCVRRPRDPVAVEAAVLHLRRDVSSI